MFKAKTQIRVRYAETDQMGYVYYGNYAMYFEVARVEALRSVGFSYREMEDSGILMPVLESHITYLKPGKYDDLLTIQYQFTETGNLLSAFVFNQNGQLVSTIIDNRLCGTAGSFSWNGFDAKNNRLPAGVYVVLIETFNLSGKTQRLKKLIGIRF